MVEGIQNIGGGKYVMDGQTYDLGTLMMVLGFERATIIEEQIMDQAAEMKRRNEYAKILTKALADIRAAKNKEGDKYGVVFHAEDYMVDDPENPGHQISLKELMERDKDLGIGDWDICKDGAWNKDECEAAINLIKGKLDSLNSESQMDMIRLQGLMSKRDNVYQMISNLMKTDQRSKENAISNLR